MATESVPRTVEAVLVDQRRSGVFVTFELGQPVSGGGNVVTYGVTVVSVDDEVKRFGVRFTSGHGWSAYVFDLGTSTQANYGYDQLHLDGDFINAHFVDADLATSDVKSMTAWATVDQVDTQSGIPVERLG